MIRLQSLLRTVSPQSLQDGSPLRRCRGNIETMMCRFRGDFGMSPIAEPQSKYNKGHADPCPKCTGREVAELGIASGCPNLCNLESRSKGRQRNGNADECARFAIYRRQESADNSIGGKMLKLSDRQEMRAQVGRSERQNRDDGDSRPASVAMKERHAFAVNSVEGN